MSRWKPAIIYCSRVFITDRHDVSLFSELSANASVPAFFLIFGVEQKTGNWSRFSSLFQQTILLCVRITAHVRLYETILVKKSTGYFDASFCAQKKKIIKKNKKGLLRGNISPPKKPQCSALSFRCNYGIVMDVPGLILRVSNSICAAFGPPVRGNELATLTAHQH